MSRSVSEWIASHDDQAIPPRVKLRVFALHAGTCAICTGRVTAAAYDHITALCNGGVHRESNLQLLCLPCHKVKTAADVGQKKKDNRVKAKHLGVMAPRKKIQSRGFGRSEPQRTASRPIEKRTSDQ